jgi:hypothetical protein
LTTRQRNLIASAIVAFADSLKAIGLAVAAFDEPEQPAKPAARNGAAKNGKPAAPARQARRRRREPRHQQVLAGA